MNSSVFGGTMLIPSLVWAGLVAVIGGLFVSSRRKHVSLQVTKTTVEIQTELLAMKQRKDTVIQVAALPSISSTMCIPFRDGTGTTSGVSFPQVGGKGLSLLQMARVPGISVPMGFILPVFFFDAWTSQIQKSDEFGQFLDALQTPSSPAIKATCQKLKNLCLQLKLTQEMSEAVRAGLEHINVGAASLVAVRSSSPEEDLVAASFAGGYETVLGVRGELQDIEIAIAQVFASCYDERVFVYKTAQGFDSAARDPRIAVVVQLQVKAQAAGVAFSLNPLNNDQDVALISSCFGLGESVVSGLTSPDEFEIRHDHKKEGPFPVIRKVLGKKELVIHLGQSGGTVNDSTESKSEFSISDTMAQRIVRELLLIVQVYGKPMDTEWAFDEKGELVWLQARPVTTHFEVPKHLATAPGEQKYLYLDMFSSVQGLTGGLSILGSDVWGHCLSGLAMTLAGPPAFINKHPKDSVIIFSDRREFGNMSQAFKLMGKDKLVGFVGHMDMLAGRTLKECDLSAYLPTHAPAFRWVTLALRVLWLQPWTILTLLRGFLDPAGAHVRYLQAFEACWTQFQAINTQLEEERKTHSTGVRMPESPVKFIDRVFTVLFRYLFWTILPTMSCGRILLGRANKIVNRYKPTETEQHYLSALSHGLPGNVTLELSLKCEDLARCLEEEGLWSKNKATGSISEQTRELLQAIEKSPQASRAWHAILLQYGHRAVDRELDIATPKYYENSTSLLTNVLRMFDLSKELRPRALEERLNREREEAATALHKWLERVASAKEARRFTALFKGYEKLGGVRETHKYLQVKALYLTRLRLLQEGRWHYEAGRLDSPDDIFGLALGDVEGAWHAYGASSSPSLDLRALINARRSPMRKAGDPKLFDSRGLELRAKPPPATEGVHVGFPVSAGSGPVVGRTKTLRSPDEKPLLEGEILVARATDPGWTSLFVPAAAVVLEVGGPLQHGALVAREYGKPCVVGIEGVVDLFPDGTLVRVNGTVGTVELVDENEASSEKPNPSM